MITAINKSLASKRAGLKDDDKGFTLIELLVVVLIIGILAAIAIPVFLGQQNSAKDAAAKSDVANAKIAVIAYGAAHDGTFSTTKTDLKDYGYVGGDAVTINMPVLTDGNFCISEASDSGTTFGVDNNTDAVAEGSCTAAVFTKAK